MAKKARQTEMKLVNDFNGIKIVDPQNVMQSKRFMKGALSFQSPEEMLSPVINLLNSTGGEIEIKGNNPVEMQEKNSGIILTSYGRTSITAKINFDEEISYQIGVLTALDLGKPSMKIYRGHNVNTCLNQCIFGAEETVKFDLSQGINEEATQNFINNWKEKAKKSAEIIQALKGRIIEEKEINFVLGSMLKKTIEEKTENGINSITSATQYLLNEKSKYYYKQKGFNAWHLYNAMTENFNRGSFFDIPEKSRDAFKNVNEVLTVLN